MLEKPEFGILGARKGAGSESTSGVAPPNHELQPGTSRNGEVCG
jgi:hypothetical protein